MHELQMLQRYYSYFHRVQTRTQVPTTAPAKPLSPHRQILHRTAGAAREPTQPTFHIGPRGSLRGDS